MRRGSASEPSDAQGMRRRVKAVLCKAERGAELTKKELMIVQWIKHGGGCLACSGRRMDEAARRRP